MRWNHIAVCKSAGRVRIFVNGERLNRSRFPLIFVCLALVLWLSAAQAAITLSLSASRTSCAAPCAVFFDATGTTSTETTKPYHEIEYRWGFGDRNAGVWTRGARANEASKNEARGPIVAHVFTNPGTYRVALLAYDGATAKQASTTITVTAADTQWASDTLCIANGSTPTAGSGGCPSGAFVQNTSDADSALTTALATGCGGSGCRRVLFKNGDSFTFDSAVTVAVDGPGYIGGYGSGDRAILTGSSSKFTFGNNSNHDFGDWRVVGLDLDGVTQPGGSTGVTAGGAGHHVLVYDTILRRFDLGMQHECAVLDTINAASTVAELWNNWFVVDSQFTSNNAYGIIGTLRKFAVMGSLFSEPDGQHSIRTAGWDRQYYAHNDVTGSSSGAAITIRGKDPDRKSVV